MRRDCPQSLIGTEEAEAFCFVKIIMKKKTYLVLFKELLSQLQIHLVPVEPKCSKQMVSLLIPLDLVVPKSKHRKPKYVVICKNKSPTIVCETFP